MTLNVSCNVRKITSVSKTVFCVQLTANQPLMFKAGQYLNVIMSEQDKRSFSIACAPNNTEHIELHIGTSRANKSALEVVDKMQRQKRINVELAYGKAFYRPGSQPIILLIGGTGFAYAKAIIEQSIALAETRSIFLYWGTVNKQAMYLKALAEQWHKHHSNIQFIPVLEQCSHCWQGRTGLVCNAILQDYDSLTGIDVYVAGPFSMAKTAQALYQKVGITPNALYGDAFS